MPTADNRLFLVKKASRQSGAQVDAADIFRFANLLVRDRAGVLLVLTRAVVAGERVLVSQPVCGDPDGFGVYGVVQQSDDWNLGV